MKEWVLTADRFLSKGELGSLLRQAEELRALGVSKDHKPPVRDWLIIRLALLSGLRASEICALEVTDCFIGYGRSELLVHRAKGGQSRMVKIGPELKRDLRWYLRWKHQHGELHPGAYVLCSKRSPRMSRAALWRRWKRYCPVHRLQDARHTNATLLYEASQDLRLVQKQLGHSRLFVTRIYADVADLRMREALGSIERLARDAVRVSRRMGRPMNSTARTDRSMSLGAQTCFGSVIPPRSATTDRSVANPTKTVAKDVAEQQEVLRIRGPDSER